MTIVNSKENAPMVDEGVKKKHKFIRKEEGYVLLSHEANKAVWYKLKGNESASRKNKTTA